MSTTVVYFCSEDKIKAFTATQENVNPKNIYPALIQAQDIYLQDILGNAFYSALKDEILNSTLSTVNRDLINEFIAPYVLNAAYYLMLPDIHMNTANKGMIVGSSDSGSSAALEEVKFRMEIAKSSMMSYKERLRKQLTYYSYLYPDYLAFAAIQQPNRRPDFTRGFGMPRRASQTMNQAYGRDIIKPGWYYPGYDYPGCDECQEKYMPPSS